MSNVRVCIIGAGPSGMSALSHFVRQRDEMPEVVCFEKQSTWGGQWNRTWRTGLKIMYSFLSLPVDQIR